MAETNVEPWLRGTLTEVGAVVRGTLHALELAHEDVTRWSAGITDEEWNRRPLGLPSLAFQVRHLSRSLDRLLCYAEGQQLSVGQLTALKSEMEEGAIGEGILREFEQAIESAQRRVHELAAGDLEATRTVGKKQLPTTLGGLLVHVADHTQRHVGQAITTAKVLVASRS